MSGKPTPHEGVARISPYQPGKGVAEGFERVIKLSSNENPLGCSPAALAAFRETERLERYPDADSGDLRAAIGEAEDINPDEIAIGAGSEQLIYLLAQAFGGPGRSIVVPEYSFLAYRIAGHASGAEVRLVPELNLTANCQAILAAVDETTSLVFLANPNNPTGTRLEWDDIQALRKKLPDCCLLVLDGAYAEYCEGGRGGHVLVREAGESGTENVVFLRTFSKIHGLSALRLGWMHGPCAIIDAVNRVRPPFNVAAPAQAAGTAAIRDKTFVEESAAFNRTERAWLSEQLEKLGFSPLGQEGNFLLLKLKNADRAAALVHYLEGKGILIRPLVPYGLHDYVRVTVGQRVENEAFIRQLEGWSGE